MSFSTATTFDRYVNYSIVAFFRQVNKQICETASAESEQTFRACRPGRPVPRPLANDGMRKSHKLLLDSMNN